MNAQIRVDQKRASISLASTKQATHLATSAQVYQINDYNLPN